jgi:MFS family permease
MRGPGYRWLIVAAGGLLGCVAVGTMFSLPVLLRPIARDTGWSTTGISGAMTIGFLAMAVGSAFWGHLSDRIGARTVVLLGSVLIATGVALASSARTLLAFQLGFGLVVGGGTSAIFAPIMACVTGWFDTHRSLAVSLVSAGIGVAPMTMAPLVAWLVTSHDWRNVLQLLALLVATVMIPLAFVIRRPPALEQASLAQAPQAGRPAAGAAQAAPADARQPGSVGELVRSPVFLVLALTNFFCCATHSGPIFHTVSYAVSCGIPLVTAVTIYSVEGLAGLGGRIGFGLLGDRYGARQTLVAGLGLQACTALAYYFVNQLGAFYLVAAVFGFTYGGVMPLYASLAREHFPLRMMGTVIGGTTMLGSLGMATGPVLGGWLYDTLGSYGWLYLCASGFGILAMLIALMLGRVARPVEPQPVAA